MAESNQADSVTIVWVFKKSAVEHNFGTNYVQQPRFHSPWCNGYRRRGGARSVMVIVIGNGYGDMSSNPWTRLMAFHKALIPVGKVWIQLFTLQLWVNSRADWILQPVVRQLVKEKENSEFKPVKLRLKIDLCVISCLSGGVGKYIYIYISHLVAGCKETNVPCEWRKLRSEKWLFLK